MHAVIDKYESDVTAMLKGQQAKGPREVKKKCYWSSTDFKHSATTVKPPV